MEPGHNFHQIISNPAENVNNNLAGIYNQAGEDGAK
jgi:hypothetical protein